MRKLLHVFLQYVLFGILLMTTSMYAQKESLNWYFGENAGLRFTGTPPTALLDNAFDTAEGCAAISDPDGNLLFYTDGVQVYTKLHTVMPNGSGLLGHYSSMQSAVIVPKPGSESIYYIFTAPGYWFGRNYGNAYSEVDMTLNNGLGDVTAVKNIQLNTPEMSEKLTTVFHADGQQVWVIVRKVELNTYYAYLVSETGVNTTPVTSNIGSSAFSPYGSLKASPDGKKIADSKFDGGLELFDFDNATGIISNMQIIVSPSATSSAIYNEFSPDSKLLYVTEGETNDMKLAQYNLKAGGTADIIASRTVLGIGNFFWSLQVAIDGKIYMASQNYMTGVSPLPAVGVINNPNALGLDADFSMDTVLLGEKYSKLGLPGFIQSYFRQNIIVEGLCVNNPSLLKIVSHAGAESATWDFGDGSTSTDLEPFHTYAATGEYEVTVTFTNAAGYTATLKEKITVMESPVASDAPDMSGCVDETVALSSQDEAILGSLDSTLFSVTYYATQEDAANAENAITSSIAQLTAQTVFARLQNLATGCYDITSFNVIAIVPVTATVPLEVTGCSPINLTSVSSQLSVPATDVTVTYYANEQDAIDNTNAIDGTDYTLIGQTATVYIRIVQTATNCISTEAVNVKIGSGVTPTSPLEVIGCSPINLTSVTSQLGVPATDVTVTYYANEQDAIDNTNAIDGTDYTLIGQTATVYIRIVQTATNCISTVPVTVNLNPGIQPPAALKLVGCESVNLTNVVSQLGVPSNTVTVTYYNNEADALAQTNAIAEVADFTIANEVQSIYIHVHELATNCATVFEVTVARSEGVSIPTDLSIVGCTIFNLDAVNISGAEGAVITYYTNEEDATAANNEILNPEAYRIDAASGKVYVRVENESGCYAVTTISLTSDCNIPRGISPNGDMLNDNFDLSTLGVSKLIILNRYGKEVYSQMNYASQWHGQENNGKELPTGTYFYMIELKTGENKTGWVYINREQ